MKQILSLCLIVVAMVGAAQTLTVEETEMVMGHHKICVTKSGVSEDLVRKLSTGDFVEDEHLTSYTGCMFQQLGIMDGDGKLQLDFIRAHIPVGIDREGAMHVIDKCKDVEGETADGRAYNLYKCYHKMTINPLHF